MHVDGVATALLVVDGVMFDISDDVLRLFALHQLADHGASKDGVFAHIFEVAAVAQLAGKVHSATQSHVVALGAQLTTDQRPVGVCGLGVPTRRACDVGW